MASPSRRSTRDLIEAIRLDGPHFGFFQAIRVLSHSHPATPPSPIPKHLRFGTPLTLGFPASEILHVADRKSHADPELNDAPPDTSHSELTPLELTVGFMGLTGPSGVLPTAYTELLIERKQQYRDTAAHQFLDIFSHRAISLLYEAWRKHRFYLAYEAGDLDRFSRNLLDFVGVGLSHLQKRLQQPGAGIPDHFLIHYAGLLSQKPISATNIAALVNGYFGVPVELEQFAGQWIHIPTDEQTQLGQQSAALGQTACIGARTWDRQSKLRLKIGPLSSQQYNDFLPGNPGAHALSELVKFCVGHTLAVDTQLILKNTDIPSAALGKKTTQPLRLGYNLWLDSQARVQHATDAQFALLS